jgi:hypothetical protein
MQYDFKIRAEISHVKLISKALDILKSIAKGEVTRAASLFSENKFADQDEKLDVKIKEINDVFLFIQKNYLADKILNILQLGNFGVELTNIKQRFIDTGIIIKNKRLSYIEIKVTKSEIDIIYIACKLYWKILVSDFSFIETVLLHKCDKEEIRKILLEISDLSHDIQNKYIHRKSKWAYDICKAIENIDSSDIIKNIGTLPKLKIIKNG